MTFGEKLKLLRQSKNLTQTDFAVAINEKFKLLITREQVAQWELNYNLPNWYTLIPICDFFGVTVDVMIRENVTEPFRGLRNKMRVAA